MVKMSKLKSVTEKKEAIIQCYNDIKNDILVEKQFNIFNFLSTLLNLENVSLKQDCDVRKAL